MCIALLLSALSAGVARSSGGAIDGLELSLAVPSRTYTLGDDVPLRLTIRNVSTDPLRLVALGALCGYKLIVVDAQGRSLDSGCADIFNASDTMLGAGEALEITLPLKQFVLIREPGTYDVSVTRILVRNGAVIKSVPVTSNSVELLFVAPP